MKEILFFILICAVLLGPLLGCAILADAIGCNAKTANIGVPSRYDFFGGCLINVKDGTWIPLKNYTFAEVK